MTGGARGRCVAGSLVLALGAGTAWSADRAPDPEAGERKAREVCARCHVIGEQNRYGGINSTPSFYIMQEKPETYQGKLLTVNERRPHIGIGLEMEPEALEDIWAYVETLKRP